MAAKFHVCSIILILNIFKYSNVAADIFSLNSILRGKSFKNMTYEYGREYSLSINSSVEYIFEFSENQQTPYSEYPVRITLQSAFAQKSHPVFLVARQQKGAVTWQLPFIMGASEYHSVSRTLCPNEHFSQSPGTDSGSQSHPIIHLYTSNPQDTPCTLQVDLVSDFYLRLNEEKKVAIDPSHPQIYYYSFNNGNTESNSRSSYVKRKEIDSTQYTSDEITAIRRLDNDNPRWRTRKEFENYETAAPPQVTARGGGKLTKFDMVMIQLESEDDTCMLISIQNTSCPVFDNEREILYEGFYATISRRGGLAVPQEKFPTGFYIVLVVKSTNDDCLGFSPNKSSPNFFSFDTPLYADPGKDYRGRHGQSKVVRMRIFPSITKAEFIVGSVSFFGALLVFSVIVATAFYFASYKALMMDQVDPSSRIRIEAECGAINAVENYHDDINTHIEAADSEPVSNGINGDSAPPAEEKVKKPSKLMVTELCKKNPKELKKNANQYLWHVVVVAIFYGLPVVQLVIAHQRMLNSTGNQDLCYYNFLCANQLGGLSDFNHVFSNLGYVWLGFFFVLFVWLRQRRHRDPLFDEHFGVPQHYGLFYAMGLALVMEGVLSASYHVCPNHNNFQFDTSFMYVIAVICMVKIYQTRHPDINAGAHATFTALAVAVFVAMIGVFYPNFWFWSLFTVLHIGTCLLITLQIYYLGNWKCNFACCATKCDAVKLKPVFKSRLWLLLVANLCNLGLAIYGIVTHSKDFASHLLYVFLMNLALHLLLYLYMKLLVHKERLVWYASVLLFLSVASWVAALYYFLFHNATSWSLTPAESRASNSYCYLLNFYDRHDVWHMLSALAMFFSFLLLLTLDDDLTHTPRSQMNVF